MTSLDAHRRFFAEFLLSSRGIEDPGLAEAFASVPREAYLGPPPWYVAAGQDRYLIAPTSDPSFVYQDLHVRIDRGRSVNSGLPSLHAVCLAACRPRLADTVVHVGAGTGYYTAVLAALVGPAGSVHAYEIDGDLARVAQTNLGHLAGVHVIAGSGTSSVPEADVIYVNAGATHPMPAWLDGLKPGGRLLLPLTPHDQAGCLLLVIRLGSCSYGACIVAAGRFTNCVGARDNLQSMVLREALDRQSWTEVRSLRREGPPDDTAWLTGDGWWLSTAPSPGQGELDAATLAPRAN